MVEDGFELLERLALDNDWGCERDNSSEMRLYIDGASASYLLSFLWTVPDVQLHMACSFEMVVSEKKLDEMRMLACLINEHLWAGHFDVSWENKVILYRHALIIDEQAGVTEAQLEALIELATSACDRYFQAFSLVVQGGKTPNEAFVLANFDTEGEA